MFLGRLGFAPSVPYSVGNSLIRCDLQNENFNEVHGNFHKYNELRKVKGGVACQAVTHFHLLSAKPIRDMDFKYFQS